MSFQESDIVPYATVAVPALGSVLVFAPHPDDEVYGCGGALALHVREGQRVDVVILTAGERQGEAGVSREDESAAAAGVLGVSSVTCWGLADRGLRFDEELVNRMVSAIGQFKSRTIYAPSLWEAHPDHRVTAMAAMEAVRRLGGDLQLWLYEVSAPLRPSRLVDISAVGDLKLKAMHCFSSQEKQLPYANLIGALNRYRALTVFPAQQVEAFEVFGADELRSPAALSIESERGRLARKGIPAVPRDVPLVSVIVRTMGRDSLQRAISSALLQTYPRVEIVVVDAVGDGSVLVLADDLASGRVRLIESGQRMRRSLAANQGLESADGEWLLILDDDDWLYPDHVSKLVNAVTHAKDTLAAHTAVECVSHDGSLTGRVFDFPFAPRELRYGNFMPIHGVLFSRQLLIKGCRFDVDFDLYEDWDFWLQVEQHTAFTFVPKVSAAYLVGGGSGAGVRVDADVARRATEAIYRKWGVLQSDGVFHELISRSLQYRELRSEWSITVRELKNLSELASAQQKAAIDALAIADSARLDAHSLRLAHDAACASREEVALERAQMQGERDEARQAAQQLMRSLQDAQQNVGVLIQADIEARTKYESAQAEYEGAQAEFVSLMSQKQHELDVLAQCSRDEVARLNALLGARQRDIDSIRSTRSWQVTRPLRFAGKVARAIRRLGLKRAFARGVEVAQTEGVQGVIRRLQPSDGIGIESTVVSAAVPGHIVGRSYADWVAAFDAWGAEQQRAIAELSSTLPMRPLISIVMPVYNTRAEDLQQAVDSVRAQTYTNWELCVCDDASTAAHVPKMLAEWAAKDSRIKWMRREANGHIARATNDAIALASGSFVAFFDHDDVLAPHALVRVVEAIGRSPDARLLYSDEDKLGVDGERFDPYFKPDFNLGLLRSHNYLCHFAVYEASLLKRLGGIREGFDGAQDYDMALRAVDEIETSQIVHLPHVLYHWRVTPGSTAGGHQEKSYAFEAGQRAIAAHLERRGLLGEVLEAPEATGMYRVKWTLPEVLPTVSIVIPTRNGLHLLSTCLSTLKATTYKAFEVIIVDNGSDDPATLSYLADLESRGEIRVLRDSSPFNFSALNNRAVQEMAEGEFVLLMNNDIELTDSGWLDELVGMAQEPGVGCVGARLWYPDGRLQHAGVIMVCGVAGHSHKYLPRGQHGYMGRAVLAQDFLAVTAACLLVRRSVFLEVGGLDETLQVAFNDVDFCLKVHNAGYRNVWTPYAEMVHHESVSRGHEDTPEKQRRFAGEIAILQARWPELLAHDPCYSPNLTIQSEDFSLAWPPRRTMP